MLKVLHFINDLNIDGGAQRIVQDLAADAQDTETTVVTIRPAPLQTARLFAEHGIRHTSLRPFSPGRMLSTYKLAAAADVMHVHLFPALYLGALIPKRKLFTEHNTHNGRRNRPWLRFVERAVYRRYDRIVCISEATQTALEDWVGPLGGRTSIVDNGIRLGRFPHRLRTDPRPPYVLAMTGAFTSQKDQATLIRSLRELPESFRLLLVGDGKTRPALEALAAECHVEDRVEFLGARPNEELPEILRQVDLYVQSSHWEGFGLAPVEAMAAGIPTMGSNVPGLARVIGKPELLFQVENEKELADKALALFENAEGYARESQYALDRSECFDSRRMADEYGEIYRTMTNQTGAEGKKRAS